MSSCHASPATLALANLRARERLRGRAETIRPVRTLALAALLALLIGCIGLLLIGPVRGAVQIERPAPPGTGAVIVVQALDPQSRTLGAQRSRLLIGAQSRLPDRSSSNSLPPLTITDPAGQLGDCYTVTELRGPPGAPNRSTTTFAGCVWWWTG